MENPAEPHKNRSPVIAVVLLLIIGMIVAFALTSHDDNKQQAQKTSYSVNYQGQTFADSAEVVNPASVDVHVSVKNTGQRPGKPTCRIEASDQSGNYYGVDTFVDPNELAPGATWDFGAELTITNQGAGYVTKARGSCSEQ